MNRATIEFHARKIEADRNEAEAARAEGDLMTASMIMDAIKFRKSILAQHGVVIV